MGVKISLDEIKNRLYNIFGNLYEFDFSNFTNTHCKIGVKCSVHGWSQMIVKNLLKGHSCRKCSQIDVSKKQRTNYSDVIKKFKEVHGDRYDYGKFDYVNNRTKSTIICPLHGAFNQSASTHIKGHGCSKCSGNNKFSKEDFINKSKVSNLHTNNFKYDLVDYVNMHTPVDIVCPTHGVFTQLPHHHVRGVGCPKCNQSKGEKMIENYLKDNNIQYIGQKKFSDCRYKGQLSFDFFLPDYNTCIEFNGIQHYQPLDIFGGEDIFKTTVNRDRVKSEYCEKNKIKLIIIKQDRKHINIKDVETQISNIRSSISMNEMRFLKKFDIFKKP